MTWEAWIDNDSMWMRNLSTIKIVDRGAGATEVLVELSRSDQGVEYGFFHIADSATASLESQLPDGVVPIWPVVPTAALPAIRDAIDERLGRRYDESLVKELRAALDIERNRIDRLTERLARYAAPYEELENNL